MTTSAGATRPRKRPSVGVRRTGYVIAALVNAAILYLINVWPGWEELSFLTSETTQVLGVVNASLALGVVLNIVFIFSDPLWLKAAGDVLTSAVGLLVMVRTMQVFPFDFSGWSVDWTWLVWTILVIGLIGTAVGVVVQLVTLVRLTAARSH